MIPVLSREQIRSFDQYATERASVPSVILMENAGRGAADLIGGELTRRRGRITDARVTLLCGPGNNGGDGFVVARRLLTVGAQPLVVLLADPARLRGDAATNWHAFLGIGGDTRVVTAEAQLGQLEGELTGVDLIVDALLGTGLDREVSPLMRSAIEAINRAGVPVVALDIPSGLSTNEGRALGLAVRAQLTITFAHWKLGLLTSWGADHAGRIEVVDIGVPSQLYEQVGSSAELIEPVDVAARLSPRHASIHKGTAGRVVVFAGSPGKTGAALLVAHGALRAGAGLVTLATFSEAADALDQRVVEVMTARVDAVAPGADVDRLTANAHAVVIGPGLGLDAAAARLVEDVIFRKPVTKVVDADALTLLAPRAAELTGAPGKLILTPHPSELGRLLGCSAAAIEADRFAAVERSVELTGAVVLLKGPRTLVGAPGRHPIVSRAGCPALATGGAGDVLSGVCGALACQLPPWDAALCGASVHGMAAERWSARWGSDRGLLAHEVADGIPQVIGELLALRSQRGRPG